MSNSTLDQKSLLLLTMGHGARGTGRRVKGKASGAARRVPTAAGKRRAARVAAFRRDGGCILPYGGDAIALPESIGAVMARRAAVADDRRAAEASYWATVAAGRAAEARAPWEGVDRRAAVVVAYDSALTHGEGCGAAWDGMAADAARAARVTPDQRKAARAAKRAARRAPARAGLGWSVPARAAWVDARRAVRVGELVTPARAGLGWFVPGIATDAGAVGTDAGAGRLANLAEQAARAWARRFEAQSGRTLDDMTKASGAGDVGSAAAACAGGAELLSIFRAEFARAAVRAGGVVPSSLRALYAARAGGSGLTWGAWVAWRRALRLAGKAARSSLWGKGAEVVQVESVEAIKAREDHESRADVVAMDTWGALSYRSGLGARMVRALSITYGERLTVYWMLSGSRKWKSALAGDIALLRAMAGLAMGSGSHVLGDYLTAGGETGGALREAASQLGKRLAAGKLLMSGADTSAAAAAVLDAAYSARAARRHARRAAVASVRVGDVVGSAQ